MTHFPHRPIPQANRLVSSRQSAILGQPDDSEESGFADEPILITLRKLTLGYNVDVEDLDALARGAVIGIVESLADADPDEWPAILHGYLVAAFLIGYHARRLETDGLPPEDQ